MTDARLCYEAKDVHFSPSPDGAAILLIETADGQANLSVALSAQGVRSLKQHIAAASPAQPKPAE